MKASHVSALIPYVSPESVKWLFAASMRLISAAATVEDAISAVEAAENCLKEAERYATLNPDGLTIAEEIRVTWEHWS